MPYVPYHRTRRHAAMSLYKKRFRHGLMLVLLVLAATYALNFFFHLGHYMPTLNEPKDLEREMQMKRQGPKH